jgi:hypothetical protein
MCGTSAVPHIATLRQQTLDVSDSFDSLGIVAVASVGIARIREDIESHAIQAGGFDRICFAASRTDVTMFW